VFTHSESESVTLGFTLISYFATVFSFILLSTDSWFPYDSQWCFCLMAESMKQ